MDVVIYVCSKSIYVESQIRIMIVLVQICPAFTVKSLE